MRAYSIIDDLPLSEGRSEHLAGLANADIKLNELYVRVLENLHHSTPEIRALALDVLDIKVYAKAGVAVEIHGTIPLELPTIEQTSGCLPFHAYVRSSKVQAIR